MESLVTKRGFLRALWVLVTPAFLRSEPWAPTDVVRLNKYTLEYTKYLRTLENGIIDLRQWADVEKARLRLR